MSMLLFRSVLRNHSPVSWVCRFSQIRTYAVGQRKDTASHSAISRATERSDVSADVRPIGERIKENTKTVSYMGVIAIGVTVTGIIFFAIFKELLSSTSPNNVYSSALEICKDDPRIQDSLGSPIKGYGEETRRGRRRHVAHQRFERNGEEHMRMQFYIQGIRNKATVHLEKNIATNRFRYLLVQMDHYPHLTIILEDNRAADQGSPIKTNELQYGDA